ncbi:MAG: alginate O-acetyltransferase AlgX-related protein [Ignavibacteria bacterium]
MSFDKFILNSNNIENKRDYSNKITKTIVNLVGLICLIISLLVTFDFIPEQIWSKSFQKDYESGRYGDLYFLNLVDYFKVEYETKKIPSFSTTNYQSEINEADILLFGDSFTAMESRDVQLPYLLKDSTNKKIFVIKSSKILNDLNNLKFAKQQKKKVLIYQFVERGIFKNFEVLSNEDDRSLIKIYNFLMTLKVGNIEKRLNQLLQRSLITYEAYKYLASAKFDHLKILTQITPIYKAEPPWLFYYEDVNQSKTSFYYKFTQTELEILVMNAKKLQKELIEKYNLELIIMPIPNKYTIYNEKINTDKYNNIIPEFCHKLTENGIQSINLYDDFRESEKLLYYPTDTHWNQNGINIALLKLLEVLKTLKNK